MNTLTLAAKNLRRRPFRSVALAAAVALVAAILFCGAIALKGISTSIDLGAKRLGADILVVPEGHAQEARATLIAGEPSLFSMPASVLEQVRKVDGVRRASPQLFLKPSTYQCCSPVDAFLVAFDPATDFTIQPWLAADLGRPLAKDQIIIGRAIPVQNGEVMHFYGSPLTVVQNLAATGTRFIDNGIFMTMETARQMIRDSGIAGETALNIGTDRISTVVVQLEEGLSAERAAVFIEYNVSGVKAVISQDVVGSLKGQMSVLLRTLAVIGATLWVITLVLIGVVFSMIVNTRQREIGMLRAMGARRGMVFSLIFFEAALLSLAGGIVGIGVGGLALSYLREPVQAAFNLPYLWPGRAYVAIAAACTIIFAMGSGLAAAVVPAWRSSRMEPYEAIRRGE